MGDINLVVKQKKYDAKMSKELSPFFCVKSTIIRRLHFELHGAVQEGQSDSEVVKVLVLLADYGHVDILHHHSVILSLCRLVALLTVHTQLVFGRHHPLMKIAEVNNLNSEDFISVFGNVVEQGRMCTVAVLKYRPFRDINQLHLRISQFLDELPDNDKKKVLGGLPDLAGRLAQLGCLSPESTKEQRSAGLKDLSPGEQRIITERNLQYREKFGFPFVVCARQNKKEAIIRGLKARLQNDQLKELHTAIGEVKKICWLRLLDIVEPKSKM